MLLFFMLIMSYVAFSQCQYFIDSISVKVKTEKSAYNRAIDYFMLSEEYGSTDTAAASSFWNKAVEESKSLTNPDDKIRFKEKEFYHYNNQLSSGTHHNMYFSQKTKELLGELNEMTKNNPRLRANYYVVWGVYMTHNHKESDSAHAAIVKSFDTAIGMLRKGVDNEELIRAYTGLMGFYYLDQQREKIPAVSIKADSVATTLSPKYRAKYYHYAGSVLYFSEFRSKAYPEYKKALENDMLCRDSIAMAGAMISLCKKEYETTPEERKNSLLKAIEMLKRNAKLNQQKTAQNISTGYHYLKEIYDDKNDTAKCLEMYRLSLYYNNLAGDYYGEPLILGNMGIAYAKYGYYDSALLVQNRALELRIKYGNAEGEMFSYNTLGGLYYDMKKYNKAIEYEDKARAMANKFGFHDYDDDCYNILARANEKLGNYKQAYMYLDKFYAFKDSVGKIHNDKEIYRLKNEEKEAQQQAEFDKKTALLNAEKEKGDAIAKADNKRHKIILAFVLFIVLIITGVAIGIFRSLKTTRKQKEVIEEQKKLVEQQKEIVEEKNKEILDSITYAKRLQDAILPPLGIIKKYLPESFVLYKPKDIVAGDFYWMERAGDNILIAAADCTGHGVPGAMVSVVCSNALNRTVKEFKITEPGKILDKVRELVLETFEKSESDVKDGMDISLVAISQSSLAISWSGAYNPLWYAQDGELKEVAPDKQPIGKHDGQKPFSTHSLNLKKGDILYLFTDGYADQFGGPKGKKFKYKQLQEKLLAMAEQSMDKQKEMLEETLDNWKGNLEQVDDVLIIGIKV